MLQDSIFKMSPFCLQGQLLWQQLLPVWQLFPVSFQTWEACGARTPASKLCASHLEKSNSLYISDLKNVHVRYWNHRAGSKCPLQGAELEKTYSRIIQFQFKKSFIVQYTRHLDIC